MKSVTLNPQELENTLQKVDHKYGRKAPGRVIIELAKSSNIPTTTLNRKCLVANISHIVNRDINPRILPLGLFVGCQRPLRPIKNKFGEQNRTHLWSLYRIDEAANDDTYSLDGE